jgi:hypothetical protein
MKTLITLISIGLLSLSLSGCKNDTETQIADNPMVGMKDKNLSGFKKIEVKNEIIQKK